MPDHCKNYGYRYFMMVPVLIWAGIGALILAMKERTDPAALKFETYNKLAPAAAEWDSKASFYPSMLLPIRGVD